MNNEQRTKILYGYVSGFVPEEYGAEFFAATKKALDQAEKRGFKAGEKSKQPCFTRGFNGGVKAGIKEGMLRAAEICDDKVKLWEKETGVGVEACKGEAFHLSQMIRKAAKEL